MLSEAEILRKTGSVVTPEVASQEVADTGVMGHHAEQDLTNKVKELQQVGVRTAGAETPFLEELEGTGEIISPAVSGENKNPIMRVLEGAKELIEGKAYGEGAKLSEVRDELRELRREREGLKHAA